MNLDLLINVFKIFINNFVIQQWTIYFVALIIFSILFYLLISIIYNIRSGF